MFVTCFNAKMLKTSASHVSSIPFLLKLSARMHGSISIDANRSFRAARENLEPWKPLKSSYLIICVGWRATVFVRDCFYPFSFFSGFGKFNFSTACVNVTADMVSSGRETSARRGSTILGLSSMIEGSPSKVPREEGIGILCPVSLSYLPVRYSIFFYCSLTCYSSDIFISAIERF